MYNVSPAYKEAIKRDEYNSVITGTIRLKNGTAIPITNDSVRQGDIYFNSRCAEKDDFELGCVAASEIGLCIRSDGSRHAFADCTIELRYGLQVSQTQWEYVPIGIFTAIQVTKQNEYVSLVALDNLILLDEPIEGIGTTGTAYELTQYCCEKCNITFGMTQADILSLPNGGEILGVSSESPIQTCRDLISHIAAILGCFACCDRQGQLVYRTFKPMPVNTFPASHRWSTAVSDYRVSYNSVSIPIGDSTYIRADQDKPEGATLELESNPLIQAFPKAQIEKALDNILAVIKGIEYTPMTCSYAGDPAVDIGDAVTVSDGNAGGSVVCLLTHINWKYRRQSSYKSVGKDPKLKVKETQSQKKINSTANSTQGTKEIAYHYENSKRIGIRTRDEAIVTIPFTAIKDTNPLFHASMTVCVEQAGTLQFTYMIDNSVYRVKAMHTVNTGYATIGLFLPLIKMKGGLGHKIEVLLKSDTVKGYIEREQLQAVVAGQGLSADVTMWDGTIKVITELPAVGLSQAISSEFTAAADFHTQLPTESGISGLIEAAELGQCILADGFTVSLEAEFVIENHTYWFDKAHQADYEYFDTYYFEIGDDYIKVADNYLFEAVKADIDSGFLQMAQIQNASLEQITAIRIEVLIQ